MAPRARIHFLFGLALLLALTVPVLGREQKILQKSLTDIQARAADSWLDQASPTTNHGADPTVQVRSLTGSQNQRTVVQFDLSSIPRSGIKLATLTLFMSSIPGAVRTYNVGRVTSLWTEPDVTWNNRLPASTAWTTPGGGGDISGVTTSATTPGAPGSMSWTITSDVQKYFGGPPPVGNYGAIISDSAENDAAGFQGIFSSKENATIANRPSLTVEFLQQVTGLTATPGNGSVTVSWSYPAPVGTVLSATDGVVILRKANQPVDDTTIISDGTLITDPSLNLCAIVGTSQVVFKSNTLATTFTDSGGACPPTNGNTYFYKVFVRDAANNYSANGANDSSFVSVISAMPNAAVSGQENSVWIGPTGSATLAAPGIIPLSGALVVSNSHLVQGFSLSNGSDLFAPASTGGAMSTRPPALDAATSSLGRPVTYLPNQDNFVYAVAADTGQILWLTNPAGAGGIGSTFINGAAVHVNSLAAIVSPSCTPPSGHDLVIVGSNALTQSNQISALDGNTGAVVWQVIGSGTQSQSNPGMGTTNGTPSVDYMHCRVWVGTTNFANSTGALGRPSLWKINPQTGALLGTANVVDGSGGTGDITESPTLTRQSDMLIISNENAETYAMSPTLDQANGSPPTITKLATTPVLYNDSTPSAAAGTIKDFPLVLGTSPPYTIVYSRNVTVHAVTFNPVTLTFTKLWSVAMPGNCNVSSPVGFFDFSFFYVGCSDGKLYEMKLADGTINKTRNVNTGAPATIGSPSLALDEVGGVPQNTGTIMVGSTDGHVHAFRFPF